MSETTSTTAAYHDSNAIASPVKKCLKSFGDLLIHLKSEQSKFTEHISKSEVEDQLARFKIWAGNTGAHRTGRGSLDFRLRDASNIKHRVISLINDMDHLITDAIAIMCGEKEPWDSLGYNLDDSSSEEDYDIQNSDPSDETELGLIIFSTGDIVSQLFRVSVSIRHPAPHDHILSSDYAIFDEQFDINHVRDRFPEAHADVVTCLGKANSRRRSYLRYRRSQWEKISYGINDSEEQQGKGSKTRQQNRSTIAPSVAGSVDITLPSGLDEDGYSDASSQTSSSSIDSDSQLRSRIPPMPQEGLGGKDFQCPLCFKIIAAYDTKSWRKHVFEDLRPYTCTFPECSMAQQMFQTRREWFQHENQFHRRTWHCIDGCDRTFQTEILFEDHMKQEHLFISDQERASLIEWSSAHPDPGSRTVCCLCGQENIKLHQLKRHLGKHQENLALFVLSAFYNPTKDEESAIDSTESDEDEDTSAHDGERRSKDPATASLTVAIPCHHISLGDLLILQGRPCQVIRITTSRQTGQHRYLGVDIFTKELHEQSSFLSKPAPSVVVQNMLGPVFKQYRVLDVREDGKVVVMTETGDIKEGLPVLDQGGLYKKLVDSFVNGRSSIRVLVISDTGTDLVVDYKVVHGLPSQHDESNPVSKEAS